MVKYVDPVIISLLIVFDAESCIFLQDPFGSPPATSWPGTRSTESCGTWPWGQTNPAQVNTRAIQGCQSVQTVTHEGNDMYIKMVTIKSCLEIATPNLALRDTIMLRQVFFVYHQFSVASYTNTFRKMPFLYCYCLSIHHLMPWSLYKLYWKLLYKTIRWIALNLQ